MIYDSFERQNIKKDEVVHVIPGRQSFLATAFLRLILLIDGVVVFMSCQRSALLGTFE